MDHWLPRRGDKAFYMDEPVIIRRVLHGNHEPSPEAKQDERMFLQDPTAFWNRPDRWEHGCAPWEIEEPYRPTRCVYDPLIRCTLIMERLPTN